MIGLGHMLAISTVGHAVLGLWLYAVHENLNHSQERLATARVELQTVRRELDDLQQITRSAEKIDSVPDDQLDQQLRDNGWLR